MNDEIRMTSGGNDECRMSNDELPKGWTMEAIDSLGEVRLGKMLDRAKNQGNPCAYLRNINVRWNSFDLTDLKTVRVSPEEMELFSVRDGDVFVCEGGEPGRAAVWRQGANLLVYQKALLRFRTNGSVVPEWLMHRLKHDAGNHTLATSFSGSTIKHFTRHAFLKYRIPLAPLPEQKRIADKLDAVLTRVDACRARLDRVPALLKRFRQSVLNAATSGRLTAEWRMTNGVNDEWEKNTAGSIITKIEAGLNVQCEERPPRADEKGLVKISAVTWGTYDDEKSKTLPTRLQVPESTRIGVGDFLISRANTLELVGACVIVHKASRPVYLSDKILRLVMPDDMKPWLLMVLQSPNGRKQIESLATGNQLSMRNLAQANLRQIQVPKPTLQERKEIVRRVEALFAIADRIEARLAVAQKTVGRLTPSVLAKAFRGELVPQDPSDEPTSVLLDRIRHNPTTRTIKPARGRHAKTA